MNAHDAEAYILEKLGRIPALKLQKLLCYAQAWSLVWDDRPLFRDRIEAWANGPVVVTGRGWTRMRKKPSTPS